MLFIMLVYHVFLFRRTIRITHTIVHPKKHTHNRIRIMEREKSQVSDVNW